MSLVLHGGAVAAALYVGTQEIFTPRVDRHSSLTFLTFTPPHVPVELPDITLPPEATRPLEPPPQVAEITPVVMTAPGRRAASSARARRAAAAEDRRGHRAAEAAGEVRDVASAAAAPAAEPKRVLQTAGFDVAAAAAPDLKLKIAQVGAFESQPAAARV